MKNKITIKGYTLTELLTVVLIVAISLTIALPTFTQSIENAKISTTLERLTHSMRLAQSASARTGETAFVCASSDANTCNAGGNWSDGWIVVEQTGGTLNVLKVEEPVPDSINLNIDDFTNTNRITFTPFGNVAPGVAPGVFVACDTRGPTFAKAIVITEAGIIRAAMDTNGNQIVENSLRTDISC